MYHMKTNYMIYIQILFFLLFFSCKSDSVTKVLTKNSHELPSDLREVSGMTYVDGKLWVIQDAGNTEELFQLSNEGKIAKKIKLTSIKNHDWEAITHDDEGNLYIGDFGNNNNARENLAIYKIKKSDLNKTSIDVVETIYFNYEDQKDFPPKKKELFYDIALNKYGIRLQGNLTRDSRACMDQYVVLSLDESSNWLKGQACIDGINIDVVLTF